MWLFPHQQAEKSLQNQHVLSILQVGSHQLQYRFFRTNKPKSRHKTNTFCPLTLLSFNPQVIRQHKLEGAGPEADPFEYPINTVQVFRCAPFLGSPLVGVALGLTTVNVRTSPVGTIERSWQFPENFSASGPGSRLRAQDR